MTKRSLEANYFKIGAFVLFGIGLIILALLVFGSQKLFEPTAYIETYFEESVQGTSIGSPVKYRGLQIGYVKDIRFTGEIYGNDNKRKIRLHNRSIYVKIAITSKLFTNLSHQELEDFLAHEVESGLRVKLAMQGLTGTTYLELNYVDPKENPPFEVHWKPENIYVPSVPSTITRLSDNVQVIMDSLKDVDFKKLFGDLAALVDSMNGTAVKADDFIARMNTPAELTLRNLNVISNNLRSVTELLKNNPSQIIFSAPPPALDLEKL